MAVLIDLPLWPAHGRHWSHLVSDTSYDELHSFALALGVPARAFEGDHYDVPQERWSSAVAAGAEVVDGRELVRRLRAAGLRRSKRRGEKVLASRRVAGRLVDVLVSPDPAPAPVDVVRRVSMAGGRVALSAAEGGWNLPRAGTEQASEGRPIGFLRRWSEDSSGRTCSHEALVAAAGGRGAPPPEVVRWCGRDDLVRLAGFREWLPLVLAVLDDAAVVGVGRVGDGRVGVPRVGLPRVGDG